MNYLALGDSISIDTYTSVADGGAASQLARLLGAAQFQNLTRDGRTTAGVLEAWGEITLAPDVVTLTAGGNDFLQGAWRALNTKDGWEPVSAQPLANLNDMVSQLDRFQCPIILNTIYDPTDGDDSLLGMFGLVPDAVEQARTAFNAINNGIRDLAAKQGFLLSDLEKLFHGHGVASVESWIVSHIEPNLAGATAIAKHWNGLYEAHNSLTDLERIEKRYGLRLPPVYLEMRAQGWFEYAPPDHPNLLWLPDAEWMSLKEIVYYQPAEYHKPGYVPFATTAGGDHWCWWPAEHPEVIVSCPHDCYEGEFYAPSFTGFIYRQFLDFATQTGLNPTDDSFDPECDPLQAQVLQDSAVRLTPYLPDAWRKTLEEIAAAAPTRIMHNGKDIGSALLTSEQYQAIVQRDLAFPLLDQRFFWMDPDA